MSSPAESVRERASGAAPMQESAARRQFDPASFDPASYSFVNVVRRHGEAGRAWAEAFDETPLPGLIKMAKESLLCLRRREVERGRELLAEVRRQIEAIEASDSPAPVIVVRRWLHGIEAFLFYVGNDFEAALDSLDAAEDSVRRSVEEHELLIPFATQALDFSIQRARVARDLRQWATLDGHLDKARAMIADEIPFFVLSSGRAVSNGSVLEYYRQCELSDEEHRALDYFYEESRRIRQFEERIARIAMPAHFVVPYR